MDNNKMKNCLAELANKARKTFAYRKAKLISDFTESFSKMMDRRGVSRAELARRIEVKPTYVTRILRGSTNFTFETMVKIADALNCSIDVRLVPNERKALCQSLEIWDQGHCKENSGNIISDYIAFADPTKGKWRNVAMDKVKSDVQAA